MVSKKTLTFSQNFFLFLSQVCGSSVPVILRHAVVLVRCFPTVKVLVHRPPVKVLYWMRPRAIFAVVFFAFVSLHNRLYLLHRDKKDQDIGKESAGIDESQIRRQQKCLFKFLFYL